MSDTPNQEGKSNSAGEEKISKMDREFDTEAKKQGLINGFASMDPDQALQQIAILPYYHQLENEITRPNQGIFTTRYFLTKWRPSLGADASNIVIALRLLANKDGETFASLNKVGQYAGMGVRSLKRWFSENEEVVQDRSDSWKAQWRLLHKYFFKKSSRYIISQENGHSRAKRTTNLYQVAMDEPIHPDDQAKLHEKAAERIVTEEAEKQAKSLRNSENSYKGPAGP